MVVGGPGCRSDQIGGCQSVNVPRERVPLPLPINDLLNDLSVNDGDDDDYLDADSDNQSRI